MIITISVFYSGCASKDEFYKGTYNWIQSNNFGSSSQEYEYEYENKEMSYDYYKNSIK